MKNYLEFTNQERLAMKEKGDVGKSREQCYIFLRGVPLYVLELVDKIFRNIFSVFLTKKHGNGFETNFRTKMNDFDMKLNGFSQTLVFFS